MEEYGIDEIKDWDSLMAFFKACAENGMYASQGGPWYQYFQEKGLSTLGGSVPVILLDSYFDSADCSCVLINNAQGAYLATSYLIDRCGRQPGHLCQETQDSFFF